MCKVQAFSLLVVTLLLFSQESSVTADNRKAILSAAMDDVKTLTESLHIKQIFAKYRVPQNVPETCSMNALACFVDPLNRIQNSLRSRAQDADNKFVGDIITNIQAYLENTIQKEVDPKELCNQCQFPRNLKNVKFLLDNLLNLLQRVIAKP